MAPRWAKRDVKRLQAAMRVLREEDPHAFELIVEQHCATVAKLFLEPRHAIQQRSAQALWDDVEQEIEELIG